MAPRVILIIILWFVVLERNVCADIASKPQRQTYKSSQNEAITGALVGALDGAIDGFGDGLSEFDVGSMVGNELGS